VGSAVRAHAAVLGLLSYDPILQSVFGINLNRIWPAQSVDVVPRKGPFIILRWEEETLQRGGYGRREVLTVWAHEARESSTDYGKINEILDRVEEILMNNIHVSGTDGVLTQVTYNGRSGELHDEGYKTITRNAAFSVGSR
jgi:hypothetical protein